MALTQIQTAMLADLAVTDAKIAAVAASKVAGQLADANMSPGSIIQVVQAVKTDTQGINATGWTNINGLSLNITPSATTSRILIMAQMQVGASPTSSIDAGFGIYRDSTLVLQGDAAGSRSRTTIGVGGRNQYEINSNTLFYVDSPSSTSSLNYNIKILRVVTDGTLQINREWDDGDSNGSFRATSQIIAMEIAG